MEEKVIIQKNLEDLQELLKKYNHEFPPDVRAEINKKLNKLLRIKNSNNLEYIRHTAEELINFIQDKQRELTQKVLKMNVFN